MSLVEKLNTLIAARLRVRPQDVTDDFICRRRAARRSHHDDTNPIVGGRTTDGLHHMTDEEAASALKSFHQMVLGDVKK